MASTPTDFGTDVAMVGGDIDPFFRPATGPVVLANAVLRRFSTAYLFYAPGTTMDLRQWLNRSTTPQDQYALKSQIETIALFDQRVLQATAGIDVTVPGVLTVTLQIDTAQGPFTLVIQASQLTVKLLSMNNASV